MPKMLRLTAPLALTLLADLGPALADVGASGGSSSVPEPGALAIFFTGTFLIALAIGRSRRS